MKGHLTHVFQALGVVDRTQAALWAERHGLLKDDEPRPVPRPMSRCNPDNDTGGWVDEARCHDHDGRVRLVTLPTSEVSAGSVVARARHATAIARA